jgi:Zn-dependent alcohol dehydrogenase
MFNLKNKRIAVYGMGVSGLSALRLIKALEGDIIAINGGETASWAKSPGVLDFVSLDQCFCENDASLPAKLKEFLEITNYLNRYLKKIYLFGEKLN